jgi:peptidyl-prolyl cis-trans isomerase D
MFDTVRSHQRILLAIILLLIMPAFVFFGISGYDRMFGSSDDVAVVAGERISRQALDAAHRQQLDQLREMAGGQLEVSMFDTPQARQQTLENLITQQALLAQARSQRMTVSDEEIRKAIVAIPVLNGPDGKFDYERYRTVLAQQGMTPAGFEAQMKQDLSLQMLGRAVQESAIVSQTVVDRVYAILEEKRTVRVRTFDPKPLEEGIKPTDEQIRKYYEDRPSAFMLPESVDVETVVFDRSAIEAPRPSEADLQAYYEQNKARFGEPDQRRASHILVKAEGSAEARAAARARADALLAKVKVDPSSFGEVARAESADPGSASQGGDLGWFGREMMVTPFSDAAFAMKEGEIGGPIETEFGYHVIQLTGIKGAEAKPFAAVRDEIEKTWREQESARRFNEQAEQFNNLVYEQPETLQPAADRFKLAIEKTTGVTRNPGAKFEPGSPLANDRLRASLFSESAIQAKRNVEAVEIAPGRVAAARVAAHHPATREPLEAVAERIRAAVIVEEAAKLAIAEGEKVLAAFKEGKETSLDGFAPPVTITRAEPGSLQADAASAIYALPPEPVPAYTGVARTSAGITPQGGVTTGGFELIRLEKVEPPAEPVAADRKDRYRQQAERLAAQTASQAYVEAVRARTEIKRH